MPKLKFLLFAFLLLNVAMVSGQIVTSKKEAVKKGIYQKPAPNTGKEIAMVSEKPEAKEKPKVKTPNTKKTSKSAKNVINDEVAEDIIIGESENYFATQLVNNSMQFLGVRYRGGGTTVEGMDCSGMVTAVFNIFDKRLPRSSHEMATVGEKVDPSEAQKGDLIFFRTNGRSISHVGIITEVLEDEVRFIHSSTSQGVIISSTNEAYYKKTFVQINRVL